MRNAPAPSSLAASSSIFLVQIGCIAGLAPLCINSASAGPSQTPPQAQEQKIPFTLEPSTQWDFLSSNPAGPSGAVSKNKLGIPLFLPLSDTLRVIAGVSAQRMDYGSVPFRSGGMSAWDLGGYLSVDRDFNDRWSATIGVLGDASFEQGAAFGKSLTGGVPASVGYRWSKTLKTSFGALYLSRLDNHDLFVPTVGLEWQASPSLLVTINGLEARATKTLGDQWELYWRAQGDLGGGRLQKRANTSATSFNDDALRTGPGLGWHPNKSWTVSLDGGVAVHALSMRDSQKNEVSSATLVSPYIGLGISADF